jgi:hypothetical protein
MTTVMFRMKFDTSILFFHVGSVNIHLLQLVMKLMPLDEAIGRGDTPEANHRPNIFHYLHNRVGDKLMELNLKLQQYIRKN